jgi:hypothetical protein
VQGSVAQDFVAATRVLKDLVNSGLPPPTITLRVEWLTLGARLLITVDPATLPAERYKTLALRVGQSTEAQNAANWDQDFTLEVSSGSRTFAIRASSLHRLLYPDVVFGAGKIVMQSLRLPVHRLVEHGVDPATSGPSPWFSTGGPPVWSTSARSKFPTSFSIRKVSHAAVNATTRGRDRGSSHPAYRSPARRLRT